MTIQSDNNATVNPVDPVDPVNPANPTDLAALPPVIKYMELCYVIVDDIYIPQGYRRRQLSEYESACPYIYCLPLEKDLWTSFRPGANMLYTYTKMPDASVDTLHGPMTIGQWYCVYDKYEMAGLTLSPERLARMRARGYVN
jgi:hypothetical protein